MIVDCVPLTPEAESLAPPLRGPKHAPFARFRVLLLVVRDSKARHVAGSCIRVKATPGPAISPTGALDDKQ